MSIFQRTIKLVLATSLAFWLADQLGLSYASSAGVIALLSILDTRRTTVKVAGERFVAALLALGLASFIFKSLGFSLVTFTIFLGAYVPLVHWLGVSIGLAPSTVLVLHLLQEKTITWSLLGNELALFGLGAGLALLVNLYMPSKTKQIESYHQLVEDQLRAILYRFQDFLLSGNGTNKGLLIDQLDQVLALALELVYRDRHNQLFNQTNYQVHYFEMRRAQLQVLRRMAVLINDLHQQSAESLILAQLFSETAQQLSETNPGQGILQDIDRFLATFRSRELPQTRAEFESRALLFQLLNDMRLFTQLKVDFARDYEVKRQEG